jgi:hypothetical protein
MRSARTRTKRTEACYGMWDEVREIAEGWCGVTGAGRMHSCADRVDVGQGWAIAGIVDSYSCMFHRVCTM